MVRWRKMTTWVGTRQRHRGWNTTSWSKEKKIKVYPPSYVIYSQLGLEPPP